MHKIHTQIRMKGRNIRLVFRGHILNLITFLLLFLSFLFFWYTRTHFPFFTTVVPVYQTQTKELTKKRIRNKWMEIHHVSLCAITQILVDMVFLHLFKMLFLLHMCEMLLLLVQFFPFCKVPPLTSRVQEFCSIYRNERKSKKKSQINLFVLGTIHWYGRTLS